MGVESLQGKICIILPLSQRPLIKCKNDNDQNLNVLPGQNCFALSHSRLHSPQPPPQSLSSRGVGCFQNGALFTTNQNRTKSTAAAAGRLDVSPLDGADARGRRGGGEGRCGSLESCPCDTRHAARRRSSLVSCPCDTQHAPRPPRPNSRNRHGSHHHRRHRTRPQHHRRNP